MRANTEVIVNKGEMNSNEKTMIYYLVNLILFKQYNVANSLIKKHYRKMKKDVAQIFKANIRRFQALSLYQMYRSEIP